MSKPGRKNLYEKNLNINVTVRFTDEQLARINFIAEVRNISRTEYIRYCMFNNLVKDEFIISSGGDFKNE